MLIARNRDALNQVLSSLRATAGADMGFVPTMGALHAGHLSLIMQSRSENKLTVSSIFVNPTQFNQASDLVTYPRTIEADIEALIGAGCDLLFLPDVETIYPQGPEVNDHFDFEGLDCGMEGDNRPGHFAGVAQVVKILLELVGPDRLYLGQKDWQQYCVLRRMVELLKWSIEVIACPIVREPDGLAMSSRNVRLGPAERAAAPRIAQALFALRDAGRSRTVEQLRRDAVDHIDAEPHLRCEYLDFAQAYTLKPIGSWDECPGSVAVCTAVWAGEVRLIDNVLLKGIA